MRVYLHNPLGVVDCLVHEISGSIDNPPKVIPFEQQFLRDGITMTIKSYFRFVSVENCELHYTRII
jgi:hypothetical protein